MTIRRDAVVTDGYAALAALGQRLKGRVQVTFVNELGVPEAGVDGGGLFKVRKL